MQNWAIFCARKSILQFFVSSLLVFRGIGTRHLAADDTLATQCTSTTYFSRRREKTRFFALRQGLTPGLGPLSGSWLLSSVFSLPAPWPVLLLRARKLRG